MSSVETTPKPRRRPKNEPARRATAPDPHAVAGAVVAALLDAMTFGALEG